MFAGIVVIAVVHSAEPSVALDVPAAAPCRLAVTLPPALSAQGIALSTAGWRLGVRASASALELSLRDAGGALRGWRTLQVRDEDCPLIPMAIATLVRSWIDQPLETAVPPVPPAPPPPPRVMLSPPLLKAAQALLEADVEWDDDDTPAPPRPKALTADDVELAPPPALAEPQGMPQFDDDAHLDEQEEVERKLPDEVPRFTASVHLLGGTAMLVSVFGVVQAELGFYEPFGVQLEGGVHSPISASAGLETITAQQSWFGVSLRYAVYAYGRNGFFASAGGRLERITAAVDGVDNSARAVLTGAVAAALEWRQVLRGGLFLTARTFAELRVRSESFSAPDRADVLVIFPFGVGIGVGLGWNFL